MSYSEIAACLAYAVFRLAGCQKQCAYVVDRHNW